MAKDFTTPILLGLTLILYMVAATTPFATKEEVKFGFFKVCSSTGFDSTVCQSITPSSEFRCTEIKDLWIGSQAMVLLTIFTTFFLTLIAIGRLGDKCMNFYGKVLLVFHVLMIIFGLVCTCLAAALYWGKQCGTDVSYSEVMNVGAAVICSIIGFLFAVAATVVSRKYFGSEGAAEYQAY